MIPPREQWCIQIDVTNACVRACSNCTRMIGHARETWFMPVDAFAAAVNALARFPADSPPDRLRRQKVVGMIGGEPLLHPEFPELCRLMAEAIPDPCQRGLWTGLNWRSHRHAAIIDRTFPRPPAYINPNDHTGLVCHHPVLVAARDVLPAEDLWPAIERCELQEKWSASITPKGFFFCEVAGAFDTVFDGPGGMAVTPDCWTLDLDAYRQQIALWCPRCGICVPGLPKRRDSESRDDISQSNLATLQLLGSPRVAEGRYRLFEPCEYEPPDRAESPIHYLKGR